MTERQTRLIEENLDLVSMIAKRMHRHWRRSDLEELISHGHIGLVQAAASFSSRRGCSFRTFSGHRILGAIKDGIRGEERSGGFSRRLGRMGLRVDWPTDEDGNQRDMPDPNPSPKQDDQVEESDLRSFLCSLPWGRREHAILTCLLRNESIPDISRRLGIGESRVFQLRRRLIVEARAAFATGVHPKQRRQADPLPVRQPASMQRSERMQVASGLDEAPILRSKHFRVTTEGRVVRALTAGN